MGQSDYPSWVVRSLDRDHPAFMAALQWAMTGFVSAVDGNDHAVRDLLNAEQAGRHRIRPVIGTFQQDRLLASVVGVEARGATNLLLIPFEQQNRIRVAATAPALKESLAQSRSFGVRLTQVVAPSEHSIWDDVLCESGMKRIAELVYLVAPVGSSTAISVASISQTGLRWTTFSSESETKFCETLSKSYLESQDCPELGKIRTAMESLQAHMAVGEFNPDLWFLLEKHDQPQGILLLSPIRSGAMIELVYMGVSAESRQKGLGSLLLSNAFEAAKRVRATKIVLAVDARNDSARRLYAKFGFQEWTRRSAWIANLCATER